MIVVTRVWKPRPRKVKSAETQPPIDMHMDANPLKNARTAKNKAMIMKGNMNRDIKK